MGWRGADMAAHEGYMAAVKWVIRRHCDHLARCRVAVALVCAVAVPLVAEAFGHATWLRLVLVGGCRRWLGE